MAKVYYNSKSQKNKRAGVFNVYNTQDPFIKKTIIIFFALTIATYVLIKVYLTFENHAQSLPQGELTITSSPQIQTAAVGDMVTYEIDENSCDTPVNTAQIHISYPVYQLQLQKIDTGGSAFPTEEESLGHNGYIEISRASDKPLSGIHQITKLVFTILQKVQINPLSINTASISLNTDNKNIVSKIVIDNNVIADTSVQTASDSADTFASCQSSLKTDTSVLNFLQNKIQAIFHLIER